jgi:hypothetical protein
MSPESKNFHFSSWLVSRLAFIDAFRQQLLLQQPDKFTPLPIDLRLEIDISNAQKPAVNCPSS